jgi:hypothetical protein
LFFSTHEIYDYGKGEFRMKTTLLIILVLFALSPGMTDPSQDLGNFAVFPADNVWKWDISEYQVHPNSANYLASIGTARTMHPDFGTVWNGAPIGIPYITVTASQPKIPVNYTEYGDESDPGPFPVPLNAPIEGGAASDGDRHVIVIDKDAWMLYELYYAFPRSDRWDAASGAQFDLSKNDDHPLGWTSADAAGLPIFPGLVRYEEVYIKGEVNHAIRMTCHATQRAYIYPARHYASSSTDVNLPPMGLRFRMKSSFNISGFSAPIQVICRAMKKYGLIVADNGSDWYISGAPDSRWDDDVLGELKTIPGNAFEAVLTVDGQGNPIRPAGVRTWVPRYTDAIKTPYSIGFINEGWTCVLFGSPSTHQGKARTFDLRGRILRSDPYRNYW